jgi:hypothetical protein
LAGKVKKKSKSLLDRRAAFCSLRAVVRLGAGNLSWNRPGGARGTTEITATQADNLFFAFVCDAQNQYSQTAHPSIGWTKQGMDGLEILVDRGTGAFAFLALDTIPDYLDTAPLPAPGTSAVWKYKATYRLADEQVGQWSDVVGISVMG